MSDAIPFHRRPTDVAPRVSLEAPRSGEGFNINIALGPFEVGGVEPDWQLVAVQLADECRREWQAQHAKTPGA